jgi:hypothetical protein
MQLVFYSQTDHETHYLVNQISITSLHPRGIYSLPERFGPLKLYAYLFPINS